MSSPLFTPHLPTGSRGWARLISDARREVRKAALDAYLPRAEEFSDRMWKTIRALPSLSPRPTVDTSSRTEMAAPETKEAMSSFEMSAWQKGEEGEWFQVSIRFDFAPLFHLNIDYEAKEPTEQEKSLLEAFDFRASPFAFLFQNYDRDLDIASHPITQNEKEYPILLDCLEALSKAGEKLWITNKNGRERILVGQAAIGVVAFLQSHHLISHTNAHLQQAGTRDKFGSGFQITKPRRPLPGIGSEGVEAKMMRAPYHEKGPGSSSMRVVAAARAALPPIPTTGSAFLSPVPPRKERR